MKTFDIKVHLEVDEEEHSGILLKTEEGMIVDVFDGEIWLSHVISPDGEITQEAKNIYNENYL